jgi:hypothetical protein
MKTIKVLGRSDERLKIVPYGTRLNNFRVADAVQFSTDRSSASYHYIRDLQDDDVLELIFEEDIHRWVTVAELVEEYKYGLSRGEAEGVIEIPAQLLTSSAPQTSRGVTAWALKGLRVLKYDPVAKVAETIAETWDANLMEEPGLFDLSAGLLNRSKVTANHRFGTGKPILLFLHGTFSSTMGSPGRAIRRSNLWLRPSHAVPKPDRKRARSGEEAAAGRGLAPGDPFTRRPDRRAAQPQRKNRWQ